MKYCPACGQNYPDNQRLCSNDRQLLSLPDPYHLVGRTLMGKYRIDALVSVGGMGAIYSAHHLAINRRVAFKILLPNLTLGNQNMLSLFQREAELAGQLNHENIVDIIDAGQTPEGIAYIVMEWLDGHTLDDEMLEKRMLSFERTAMILREIAAALNHAHARRIIHRDLKPTNIMIVQLPDGREQVKVVDFGIAKVISEATSSVISSLIGTPHYASPEQFVLGGPIDGRSDIYSLGVLLFQMLSGHLPFNAQSPQELVRMQRTESPPSISQYRADVPVAIDQLLIRMLAKNPDDRPQTVKEASAIFEHVLKAVWGTRPTFSDQNNPTIRESPAITHFEPGRVRPETVSGDKAPKTAPPGQPAAAAPASPHPAAPAAEQAKTIQPPTPGRRKLKQYAVSGVVALAIIIAGVALSRCSVLPRLSAWLGAPSPTPAPTPTQPPRIELMSYYLEITSDQCQTLTHGRGDESFEAHQGFRLHFIPKQNGYLYIIGPGKQNVQTFLTAQSDPDMGVKTNFLEAGSDFRFPPRDDKCLGIGNQPHMRLTVIFSPTQLASPSFLTASPMRELSPTQDFELSLWRKPYEIAPPQPDAKQQRTVVIVEREFGEAGKPVVFDLPLKRR